MRRPFTVVVAVIAAALGSFFALRQMPRDIFPTLGIPVAAGVLYPFFGWLLSPIIAGDAMSLSSVSVISNALRLRKLRL